MGYRELGKCHTPSINSLRPSRKELPGKSLNSLGKTPVDVWYEQGVIQSPEVGFYLVRDEDQGESELATVLRCLDFAHHLRPSDHWGCTQHRRAGITHR